MTIFISLTLVSSITYYHVTTKGVALDTNKLQLQNSVHALQVFDSNCNKIKPTRNSYIALSKLSSKTRDAFLCAEDKRFYKHKGVDVIRIGGAIISNIKSKSFSEGASTISQQLVKNTQLSNEKTIKRKLQEIKLTKALEKEYTKDEILELYLNNIYFGNGCYGVENASRHYFSKSATNLSIAESALLAGVINAPSYYDIETNLEKSVARRNLILKLMKNYGKISDTQYEQAKNEPVNLNISDISGQYNLFKNISDEACEILNVSEYALNNSNYRIYTSINTNLNNEVTNISSKYVSDSEKATIIIDNKTRKIISIQGKNKILNHKWQPGSTIKPILVYAPAIEKGMISPATKILDNKINISGYSPENYDKIYHGYVSAKTALSKSYNIPAVKILNELGVDSAKAFATKLGIEFDESDNHLALALGGFAVGITPKTLCDAYTAFACNGKFAKSSYINKITQNGKIVYESNPVEYQAMSDSTAFLINDMLLECSKTGTGKRLNSLPFSVCSKTGTVGKTNSTKNQLAYNISYTTEHTILTILQGDDLPSKINGSTHPTMINRDILSTLYKTHHPNNFTPPNSVELVNLDAKSYTENKIEQSNESKDFQEYFSKNNLPKNQLKSTELFAINSPNHKPILCFTINKNCDYFLIRKQKEREEIIFSSLQNNENFIKFIDKTAKNNQIYTYKLRICGKLNNEEFYSNEIKLKTY